MTHCGSSCRLTLDILGPIFIHILEKKRVDAKNLLLLLKKDNTEFLVLVGSGGVLLLDKKGETLESEKGDAFTHA